MSSEATIAFGRYALMRRLAVGGMAEIFLAKQQGPGRFERNLVIKRILPHLAQDPKFVGMFLDEAALAAQLQHPCVAQVYDFGEEQGAYFIALELVRGPDLASVLEACQKTGTIIPAPIAVRIMAQVLAALDYAHHALDGEGRPMRLVHRDVSPQNVLVSFDGNVKLVDFGVAKAANASTHTEAGMVKGKYCYFAPEQLQRAELDGRCDLFAAGLVLYELLTLQKALPGEGPQAIAAALEAKIIPVSQLRTDLPPRLVKVLEQALQRDRDQRFPDCRAMLAELDAQLIEWNTTVPAHDLAQFLDALQASLAGAPLAAIERESQPGAAMGNSDTVMSTRSATTDPLEPTPSNPAPPKVILLENRVPDAPVSELASAGRDADAQVSVKTVVGEVLRPKRAERAPATDTINMQVESTGEDDDEAPRLSRGKEGWVALGVLAIAVVATVGYFAMQPSAPVTAPAAIPLVPRSSAPATEAAAATPPPPTPPAAEPARAPTAEAAVAVPEVPPRAVVVDPQPTETSAPKHPATSDAPGVRSHGHERARSEHSNVATSSEEAAGAAATFTLASSPWMEVFVDGKDLGQTPIINASLPAGSHSVKLVNGPLAISRTMTIQLSAGEPKRIAFHLEKGSVEFAVRPWADITFDGKNLGATPMGAQQAFEGRHTAVFSNPKLGKSVTRVVQVRAGSTVKVKVDLTEP